MSSDSYRSSGVDLESLDSLKERIKGFAALTHGPEVLGAGGSFAGVYQLAGYREPMLVASTDGVGTKLKIAAQLGHYESIGEDLVTLNVNDILTRGARPLFFLDYIAFSKLDQHRMEGLLRGIVWGCKGVGCALIGGETAQLPNVYSEEDFDLAGFVVGAVEREAMLDGSRIDVGNYLVGIPSSGLHTNGFSLVRRVFDIDNNPRILFKKYTELGHLLGEELLITHRSYYPMLQPVLGLVKALAHITGGGLIGKMPSILPDGVAAEFDGGSWRIPSIFPLIQKEGNVSHDEMYRVFNMGLGMVAVCQEQNLAAIQAQLGQDAQVVGRIVARQGPEQVILKDG